MVYLIGAGPGDYKLLTLRAKEIIETADVIVYDRLVSDEILRIAKKDAEFVYVGKHDGNHHVSQNKINKIIVDKALENKIVARVKGGDPFVFGRGGEEAEILCKNGIDYEFVPGITSIVAVPGYEGIPITHRNYASSFHVITGHEDPKKGDSSIDYELLAKLKGTLIFLMGIKNLKSIVEKLIFYGIDVKTPVSVIENGTRDNVKSVKGRIENIYKMVKEESIKAPAIIIMGEVVNLRDVLKKNNKNLINEFSDNVKFDFENLSIHESNKLDLNRSKRLFKKSEDYIPGGVNSPVRAYKKVGMNPPFIKRAFGSKIEDIDGNIYIDYVCSWGPMILGHSRSEVIEAVRNEVLNGTSFGAPTELEYKLAKLICEAVPSIDKVRMVNSGTEAVMSAIRLARGYTKKDKIIKFEGCYHGHSDGLLVKAGSGALTVGVPDSGGIPDDYAKNTLTASYNDIESVKVLFENNENDIAAVIVEPIAGNMGVIPPNNGFLSFLREITKEYNSLLIFDEVITGFRVSYGGAQAYYNVIPDITSLGKIIGGGMPVGAFGGKSEIMDFISPNGPVYQAGTLSGNPVAMAAGLKSLEILKNTPNIYDELDKKAQFLENSIIELALKYNINLVTNRIGSLLSIFFTDEKVKDYKGALKSDVEAYKDYFQSMLKSGIYLAPSPYEAMFLSDSHNESDILNTVNAVENTFKNMNLV